MKTMIRKTFWASVLLVCAVPAFAQYSVDWNTIDGGGGTSTGGVYSVSGTIGQLDAGGPMIAGQYSVTGGFWALPTAVQTTGAPLLKIFATTTNTVIVAWPVTGPNFQLQESTDLLLPSSWSSVAQAAVTNAGQISVMYPAGLGPKFFRLRAQ